MGSSAVQAEPMTFDWLLVAVSIRSGGGGACIVALVLEPVRAPVCLY
jgi:hypothetical protein